jgi:virulence-associated protein VagC
VIAKIFKSGNSYALRLPREMVPNVSEVNIEKYGDRLIVNLHPKSGWDENFFRSIEIKDENFSRPDQGEQRAICL